MCMVNVLKSLLFVLLHLKLLPLTCIFQIEARHLHHSSVKNVHRNYITASTATSTSSAATSSPSAAATTLKVTSPVPTESQFMINDGQIVVNSDEPSINSEQVNCNYDEYNDDTVDLPAPTDISVVLASWTPPSIRVSWTFPQLNDTSTVSKVTSGRNVNLPQADDSINYTPPYSTPSSPSPHVNNGKRLIHHRDHQIKSDPTANSKVDYLHSNYNSNQLLNKQPRIIEEQIITHDHLSSFNDQLSQKFNNQQQQQQHSQHQNQLRHQQQLINCTSGLNNDLQTSNDQENSSNITRVTSKMDILSSSTNKSKCQSSGLINSLAKLEAFRIIYHPIKTRFRMIREVSPLTRNVTIDGLEPNVNYELVVIALFESPLNASIPPISKPLSSLQTSTPNYPKELYKFYHQQNKNKQTNSLKPRESASESIRFISPDIEPGRFNRHSRKPLVLGKRDPNEKVTIKTDELVIVILVLCVWCGVICLFIKKWGKIRAIEPCQSYFSPEIYDIPLKKSTNGGGSNGDLSNAPNGHDSSQLCQSTTGDGITGVTGSAGGTFMASTESRRSLTTSMTIAAAAAATMAANASITGGHRRDSYPRFLGSPSPSSLYLTVHRPRINSVFVTPPTRPPTPLPMTINYSPGSSTLQQQQLQLQLQQQQQSSGHPCANVKHIESPSTVGDSSANGSSSIPRRFKSAEDLRSIVNEFTRRKSTLLMSASYFQQQQQQQHLLQQQQSRSAHGSSHQQQSILERETSIPSTSSSPSYSQQQQQQQQPQQAQQQQSGQHSIQK